MDEDLLQKYNLNAVELKPFGLAIYGMNFKVHRYVKLVEHLEFLMAKYGFITFKNQGVMSGADQVNASILWGGKRMHSTHGVHPKAPNKHIFRLSNNVHEGILGVGPQWHNDGSFERAVFSHVGYHIIKPQDMCGTEFSHQGIAHKMLTEKEKIEWEYLTSVNSNSGVLHPLIHKHPISGIKSVWLHLGMTGAVIRCDPWSDSIELLEEDELRQLMKRYNALLNNGYNNYQAYSMRYEYEAGDMVFIDNMAIAHRAMKKAHFPVSKTSSENTRILHRTTIAAKYNFDPINNLPFRMTKRPCENGVWIQDGNGFVWDENERIQN